MVSIKTRRLALFLALLGGRAFAEAPQNLPRKSFHVCGKEVKLQTADTPESRTKGLMFRTSLEGNDGMIFVFERPQELVFWMRHVSFNIDIGYFSSKGDLVSSTTMVGTSDLMKDEYLARYPSAKEALYAVEVPEKFFSGFSKAQLAKCRLSPVPKPAKE